MIEVDVIINNPSMTVTVQKPVMTVSADVYQFAGVPPAPTGSEKILKSTGVSPFDYVWVDEAAAAAPKPTRVYFTNQTQVQVLHNLGYLPKVDVLDSSGNEVFADVEHTSDNNFYVRFAANFTGSINYI